MIIDPPGGRRTRRRRPMRPPPPGVAASDSATRLTQPSDRNAVTATPATSSAPNRRGPRFRNKVDRNCRRLRGMSFSLVIGRPARYLIHSHQLTGAEIGEMWFTSPSSFSARGGHDPEATDESACTPDFVSGLRRWRSSISACRCRQALAAYPQARASSPQMPAPVIALRRWPFLALLRVGFTEPPRSPGVLVSSYLTVSPLPALRRRSFLCGTFPRVAPGCR